MGDIGHNKPNYETLPGMIIDIAKNDKDMKGDESHVWFVLGTLWQEYGIDYNPSMEDLIALCKRSERFIRQAMNKLREKLLVAFGRAKYIPGDKIKEAISAFSKGEICPKAAIYAEKQTADIAERHNVPKETASYAEKRQYMPKETAQCAENRSGLARADIDNNKYNNINNNITTTARETTFDDIMRQASGKSSVVVVEDLEGFNGMTNQIVERFTKWFNMTSDEARRSLEYQGKNYSKNVVFAAYNATLSEGPVSPGKYYNKTVQNILNNKLNSQAGAKRFYREDGKMRA